MNWGFKKSAAAAKELRMTVLGWRRRPNLGLNVFANYVGKLWSIASIYIFLPVYIHLLGIDAYGLIAFNAIALALLFIADAGLSSAFAREAARCEPGQALLDLLTSVERALLGILAIVGLIFALAAPAISTYWLNNSGALPAERVLQCLWLMPLALVPQIAMSLYFGGLMGLQRQVSANLLWTGFNIARSGLVVIPIYFLPDVRMFFVWQAVASVGMALVMRHVLHSHIARPLRADGRAMERLRGRFSGPSLRSIRRYAAGMLGMSIIAGLNTQLDKLVVSKMLPLGEFAQYSLASTLAMIPYILTLPIAAALLPRFTSLIQQPDLRPELVALYRNSSYYIASIGAVAGIGLSLFVDDAFSLWLPSQAISSDTLLAAKLLAIGGTLMTLQLMPFQLSLAHGHTATNLRLGAVILLLSVPLQVALTQRYGVIGAAIPWLFVNAVAFVYLGIALNQRFPLASLSQWFVVDSLPPILLALCWLAGARLTANALHAGPGASCAIAALAALSAIGSSYLVRRQGSASKRAPAPL